MVCFLTINFSKHRNRLLRRKFIGGQHNNVEFDTIG
jgi:hypothetical protein